MGLSEDWYYIAFPKDRWQAKSLVVLVYLIELVQTLIMMNDCWNTYAVGFGNPDGLAKVRNEWLAATVLTAIGWWCIIVLPYARTD